MAEYALRLESLTDTAPRVRMADTLALAQSGPLAGRRGLRYDGGGEVAVIGGTMTATVTPFLGWIDGAASIEQGGYPFVCDATKTLTFDAGDPAQPRTDTIIARVRDDAFDSSGATVAEVYVLKGTPGAGAAALPAACIPIRDVIIPAGASSGTGGLTTGAASTDRRKYTAGLGGVVPVMNQTDRATIPPVEGSQVYRLDTLRFESYIDGAWTGDVDPTNVTLASGFTSGTLTVERRSGIIFFAGSLYRTPYAASSTITVCNAGALPASMNPSGFRYFQLAANNANTSVRGIVQSDGTIQVETGPTAPTFVSFHGISYPQG